MNAVSLHGMADEYLRRAREGAAGRSADTVYGGHDHRLRQTVIALLAGQRLEEHESPGEATLQVLSGRVRLTAGDATHEASAGDDLVPIPPQRHALEADDDAVVLLTVVKRLGHED
jgi:quercetin dioxygenase-like cupin family protein